MPTYRDTNREMPARTPDFPSKILFKRRVTTILWFFAGGVVALTTLGAFISHVV